MSVALPLPPLTPDEAAHSARLVDRIRDEIDARGGWISFERFMEMALYEPGLGYYSAGATKLGARRRLRHRAGNLAAVQPLPRDPVRRSPAARERRRDSRIRRGLRRDGGRPAQRAGRARRLAGALSHSRSQRRPARAAARAAAASGRRRTRRASNGSIACRKNFAASCSRTKFWMRCRCSASASAATQVNALGVTWQLGRLDWSETHADAALEAAVRRIEANTRRALARRLHVGDQSAAGAVDRAASQRRCAKAWRCSSTMACRSVSTIAASVARARCCATSAIASTTIR